MKDCLYRAADDTVGADKVQRVKTSAPSKWQSAFVYEEIMYSLLCIHLLMF